MAKYQGATGVDLSFIADVDLGGYQHRLMKAASTTGYVTYQGTAAGSCIGVLMNDPKAGEEALVRVFGPAPVIVDTDGGASPAAYWRWFQSGSTGMAQPRVPVYAASAFLCGYTLEALTTGSGVTLSAFINPLGFRLA